MSTFENLACKRNHNFLTVSWSNPDRKVVRVYYNTRPEIDGQQIFLASVSDAEYTVEDPAPGQRVYFILKSEGMQQQMVGERELPMTGICNFRDLGGYPTEDGRTVKWGTFFRSGALHKLNEHDSALVRSLGIDTVFDWRGEATSKAEPDDQGIARQVVNISAMPGIDSTLGGVSPGNMLKNPDRYTGFNSLTEIMVHGYRDMVFKNEAFTAMVKALEEGHTPMLQHCESGKDRAGMGSAILLLILGVSQEAVLEDYLASNRFIGVCNTRFMEKLAPWLDSEEKLDQFELMMQVSSTYLESALESAIERYGSMEVYFQKEFGLGEKELAVLRDKYLY